MNDETQKFIDEFKRPDGLIDLYRVLQIDRTANDDEIEMAFHLLSATYHPETGGVDLEKATRFALVQHAYQYLSDPLKRKKYDTACRTYQGQATLLSTLEVERQKQQIEKTPTRWKRLTARVNTRAKRYALALAPVFSTITLYFWNKDLKGFGWEPSFPFVLFGTGAVVCLLIAFTKISDWLNKP